MPDTGLLEGLYIDDHFVIAVCPKSKTTCREGKDFDIIQRSHEAYRAADLPRAEEKGFGFAQGPEALAATQFVAIGTEIKSEPGLAGAPLAKRRHLFDLGVRCLGFDSATSDLLRRLVSLYLHPLLHRRELMSLLYEVFHWIGGGRPLRRSAL